MKIEMENRKFVTTTLSSFTSIIPNTPSKYIYFRTIFGIHKEVFKMVKEELIEKTKHLGIPLEADHGKMSMEKIMENFKAKIGTREEIASMIGFYHLYNID